MSNRTKKIYSQTRINAMKRLITLFLLMCGMCFGATGDITDVTINTDGFSADITIEGCAGAGGSVVYNYGLDDKSNPPGTFVIIQTDSGFSNRTIYGLKTVAEADSGGDLVATIALSDAIVDSDLGGFNNVTIPNGWATGGCTSNPGTGSSTNASTLADSTNISNLADLKTNWIAGGVFTISAGTYTLDDHIVASNNLKLIATGSVIIDGADTYNIIIDSEFFIVNGADADNKITFTQGLSDSLQIKASASFAFGRFDHCAFNDAAVLEGLSILDTILGNVTVTCNNCSADGNGEDGFGILDTAIGVGFTVDLTCNDCTTSNMTASDISDGFTAHAKGQTLNINDCIVTDCTNGVRVTDNAGAGHNLTVNIEGLTCTGCKRAFEGLNSDDLYIVVANDISFTDPETTPTDSDAFRIGGGTLQLTNSIFEGSVNTRYGVTIGPAVTSASLENIIISGFQFVDAGGVGAGLRIQSVGITAKNIVLYANNLHIWATDASGFQINNSIFMSATNADGAFLNTLGAWFVQSPGAEYADNANSGNNFFFDNDKNFSEAGDALKASDLSTDPGMVDPGNSDFTITGESNAFEAGDILTASVTDFLGVTRSDPPDVGAYEFVSEAGGGGYRGRQKGNYRGRYNNAGRYR